MHIVGQSVIIFLQLTVVSWPYLLPFHLSHFICPGAHFLQAPSPVAAAAPESALETIPQAHHESSVLEPGFEQDPLLVVLHNTFEEA